MSDIPRIIGASNGELTSGILASVRDGAAVFTPDRTVTAVNSALSQLTEYEIAELVGPVDNHPFWSQIQGCLIDDVLRRVCEGDYSEQEAEFRKKTGGEFTAILTPACIRDDTGAPVHCFMTIKDITDRKQAEKELTQERKNFQLVMDTIPQRLFWKDRDFVYLGCNKVFAEDAGLKSPEQIVGMNDFELSWKESAPLYRADDREVMEKDISKINYEEPQVREDGSSLWLRTTKLPIKNDQGVTVGVFGSYEDISEQKLAEDRTRLLEIQLQQSQKMEALGTLAGGIAHDFNNILTAIVGYTQLVSDDLPESDPRRDDLNQVMLASERGRQLVKRILSFSRSQQISNQVVSFRDVLADTLKFLRASIPSTIQLQVSIDDCDGLIVGSEGDIHQLVVNLATNSAHAMAKTGGSLVISLKLESHTEHIPHMHGNLMPGRYFVLHVGDTGEGIDVDNIERIFDPFFTTKETGKGTGLGLSVVHGITSRLGGAIKVDSKPGFGTWFDVYIPVYEGDMPAGVEDIVDDAHGDETILLVDDENSLAQLEKRILEPLGYEVDVFTDPLKALEAFRANPDKYDVVVTDLTMPGLTGLELVSKIRGIRENIPVVLVTGFSDDLTQEAVAEQGILAFVRKPILIKDLSRSIRFAINYPESPE